MGERPTEVLMPDLNRRRTAVYARVTTRSAIHRASWLVAMAVTILAAPIAAQDASTQIRSEAERLQTSLKERPVSFAPIPDASKTIADGLKEVVREQSAGRLYVSLEKLGQMTDFLYGVRAAADKEDAVKSGFPAYEAEWEKVSLSITASNRQAREKDWERHSAAVRAFSETSQNMSMPLLEGARGFAISMQPKDGLFNLGQAQGQAEFASFCSKLNLSRKGKPYPLRSVMPELQILQKKANAAFQPPRSVDLHTLFMSLNSALKQGQELDARRSYAGALFQYLHAVGYYGMLNVQPPDPLQLSALKSALATARRKLDASERDESIAEFFVEKGESHVAPLDGSAPTTDDWKIAKVVVEQVLPAYFAVDNTLVAQEGAPSKSIDV